MPRLKILITGAAGFSGSALAELLSRDSGLDLYLTSRRTMPLPQWRACDLSDAAAVHALVDAIHPDQIYHLAGSFTNDYAADHSSNVLATRNILNSLGTGASTRVLLIGSAAEYGVVRREDNPVGEDFSLRPASVYGLTKAYQTYLMDYYCRAHHRDIVMARTFNLLGRGASNRLFVGRIYEQITKLQRGELSRITLGDLSASRDYIDVRDAVKNYKKIMEFGAPGAIYNVGSGHPIRLLELTERIIREAGLTMDVVDYAPGESAGTPVSEIYADIKKLETLTHTAI